jgi:hypothetical protein
MEAVKGRAWLFKKMQRANSAADQNICTQSNIVISQQPDYADSLGDDSTKTFWCVLTLLTARTLTMLSEMTRNGNMLMRKQNKFLFVNKNENQTLNILMGIVYFLRLVETV